jgi:alpha-tubulin suppressor-like RCC1 family protein
MMQVSPVVVTTTYPKGPPLSKVVQIATGSAHTCARRASGGVECWGANQNGEVGDGTSVSRLSPVAVIQLTEPAQDLAAGGQHTCALVASGAVHCWGDNGIGEAPANVSW